MRVRCGRNGVSFQFGRVRYTYKSDETGRRVGEDLIAWFNVEDPRTIALTDLKEDPGSLFVVEREISVPAMDARPEVLNAALAQNDAHEEYRRALYRAVSQNFSTGFAGRMFRQNLIDHKTAETAAAMREQDAALKRRRTENRQRTKVIERKATRLGIPAASLTHGAATEKGLDQMTLAMRNLGLLE
jgi:hypothetical protein